MVRLWRETAGTTYGAGGGNLPLRHSPPPGGGARNHRDLQGNAPRDRRFRSHSPPQPAQRERNSRGDELPPRFGHGSGSRRDVADTRSMTTSAEPKSESDLSRPRVTFAAAHQSSPVFSGHCGHVVPVILVKPRQDVRPVLRIGSSALEASREESTCASGSET